MWCQTRYFTPDECIEVGNKELEFVLLPNDIRRPNGREYRKLMEIIKMTNAEKYKEVFGMEVDPSMCPTTTCDVCPCCSKDSKGNVACVGACTYEWWNKEYKDNYRAKWGVLA